MMIIMIIKIITTIMAVQHCHLAVISKQNYDTLHSTSYC